MTWNWAGLGREAGVEWEYFTGRKTADNLFVIVIFPILRTKISLDSIFVAFSSTFLSPKRGARAHFLNSGLKFLVKVAFLSSTWAGPQASEIN